MPAMQQEPRSRSSELTKQDAFYWMYRLVAGHSACFWVFTRKNFGVRAFQMLGPMALLVMLLYLMLAPCPSIVYFAAVWFVLLVVHRIITLVKRMRGWEEHSRFDGIPWVAQTIFWPRPGEFVAKAICEPLLVLAVGVLLCHFREPLGIFCFGGALSLAIKRLMERGIEEAQIQAMKDHEWEMYSRMARFRGRR